ncbi:hypothetical protein G6F62_003223 [Rhizopus arrhizus]|nr:hypothetical protein G6F62_003223 [Rhizopus arrhizus]
MSINWTSNRTEQLTSLDGLQDTAKLGYNGRRGTSIGPKANGETLFGLINRTFMWKAGNADGDSCHTAGYARWWRETYKIRGFEYWPAQSPDLNSIEHVWNAHERQIERKRLSVKNLEKWKMALQEEWARLDDEFADRLVRNMKKRCEAVSKARGSI